MSQNLIWQPNRSRQQNDFVTNKKIRTAKQSPEIRKIYDNNINSRINIDEKQIISKFKQNELNNKFNNGLNQINGQLTPSHINYNQNMYISEKLNDNSNIQNSNNFNDFLSQKKLDVIQNLDSQNKSSHNNRGYKYYSNDKYRNKNNYLSNNKSVQNSDQQLEMLQSGVSRKILSPNGYFQNEYNKYNQNYNQDLNLNQYLEQKKQPAKNDQSSKLELSNGYGLKNSQYVPKYQNIENLLISQKQINPNLFSSRKSGQYQNQNIKNLNNNDNYINNNYSQQLYSNQYQQDKNQNSDIYQGYPRLIINKNGIQQQKVYQNQFINSNNSNIYNRNLSNVGSIVLKSQNDLNNSKNQNQQYNGFQNIMTSNQRLERLETLNSQLYNKSNIYSKNQIKKSQQVTQKNKKLNSLVSNDDDEEDLDSIFKLPYFLRLDSLNNLPSSAIQIKIQCKILYENFEILSQQEQRVIKNQKQVFLPILEKISFQANVQDNQAKFYLYIEIDIVDNSYYSKKNQVKNYHTLLNLFQNSQFLKGKFKLPIYEKGENAYGPKDLKYALQREQIQHLAEVFITLNCFEDITEFERNDEIDPMDFINQNIYKLPAQSRTQIKHSFKRIQLQQIQPHKPSDYMSEMFK